MSNNVLFIHAAILNNCNERLFQYLDIIYNSELIDNLKYIYIYVLLEKIIYRLIMTI